jgi:predicted O-methyltransferase YrrM
MELVQHVIQSLNMANTYETKLISDVLALEGMSGIKTRILYNALCSLRFQGRDTRYLEVGAWKGSTLCSALFGNPGCTATVVENWGEFGGPKAEFEQNVARFGIQDRVSFFEQDVFTLDVSKLAPVDIYMYDGDHGEDSHRKAITHMWPALADQAVVVVDDWNMPCIRKGTLEGLREVGAHIVQKFEILHTTDGTHTPGDIATREFWNGVAVFVISKQQVTSK